MRPRHLPLAAALLLAAGAPAARADDAPSLTTLLQDLRARDDVRRGEAATDLVLRARDLGEEDAARALDACATRMVEEEDAAVRSLVIAAVGRIGGARAAPVLLPVLAAEEDPAVQTVLVDAFADLPVEAVAEPLSRLAFAGPSVRARVLAVLAAGRVPGERTLRTLLALADTTHPWPVAAAVLQALALRPDRRAVAHALAALDAKDPAVRIAAREAAEELIGEDLGPGPAAWRARWNELEPEWRHPRSGRGAAAAPGPSTPGLAPESRTVARFYEVPVSGRRVAFVLDCSQSMWGPAIEEAVAELAAAVKGLRRGQRFGVVFFNEHVWTWRETLAPASITMKAELVAVLEGVPTRAYTNIHDALERAFGWVGAGRGAMPDPPGLDEVFFLSDGEPNRGRFRDARHILAAVREWNADDRVRLHTVALGEHPRELLGLLAEQNGGTAVRR